MNKHGNEIISCYRIKDKVIAQSRTQEDIIHEMCLMAYRKFKNKDIDEKYGLNYLMKTVKNQLIYFPKRANSDLIFTDNLFKYIDEDGD